MPAPHRAQPRVPSVRIKLGHLASLSWGKPRGVLEPRGTQHSPSTAWSAFPTLISSKSTEGETPTAPARPNTNPPRPTALAARVSLQFSAPYAVNEASLEDGSVPQHPRARAQAGSFVPGTPHGRAGPVAATGAFSRPRGSRAGAPCRLPALWARRGWVRFPPRPSPPRRGC